MLDLRAIRTWPRIGSVALPGPVGPPRGQACSVWWDQDLENRGPGQVLIDVLNNQQYAHDIRSLTKEFGTASDHFPSTARCLVDANGGWEQVLMRSGWQSKQDAWQKYAAWPPGSCA